MMAVCLAGSLFVAAAGVSMLLDGVDGNDEIGRVFAGFGGLAALALAAAMILGGAA